MTEATRLSCAGKLTREQLALVPTPPGTVTHRSVPHIGVVRDEYAVSHDGKRVFGIMELEHIP